MALNITSILGPTHPNVRFVHKSISIPPHEEENRADYTKGRPMNSWNRPTKKETPKKGASPIQKLNII